MTSHGKGPVYRPVAPPDGVELFRYSFGTIDGLSGWGLIVLGSDGFFATVSDYGNYAFRWTHHGEKDFREFLLHAERDWDYFANKLAGSGRSEFDGEATLKLIKTTILQIRRTGGLSEERAKCEWDLVLGYGPGFSEGDFHDWHESTQLGDAWEMSSYRIPKQAELFVKEILVKRLVPVLREELDAKRLRELRDRQAELDAFRSRHARDYTNAELASEIDRLGKEWDAFQKDGEGHGGSPGEGMYERMAELEQEQKRRKAKSA